MINSVLRKIRQVVTDPVLRRWLVGRVFGRWPGEPSFSAHRPPYLKDLLPLKIETPRTRFSELGSPYPTSSISLLLAGETIVLQPGDEKNLFQRTFKDLETMLSLHRFAWLPLARDIDPAWVSVIWQAWAQSHGTPDNGWSWHPYTAAERAINITRFAGIHGLPGKADDMLALLAAHVPVIADRLEYFGDHHTSNHLANNGRGLFLLGLWLGLDKAADVGGKILLEEAKRIFTISGMLRENSSHYHLLLAHNYEDARSEAEKYERAEAAALAVICNKALRAAKALVLPGGFPLIGDISPDCPPDFLLEKLSATPTDDLVDLNADGWVRFSKEDWCGLWHTAPDGWSQMPGHGHQDTGAFELHYKDEPVLIDPGRGAYGDSDDAVLYATAQMHNGLTIDGNPPYPPNRPYFDDTFRRSVCGEKPALKRSDDGVRLTHHGFSRLRGCGTHERFWRFEGITMNLSDRVDGHGHHTVTRTLITPLNIHKVENGIFLLGKHSHYQVQWRENDCRVELLPIMRWQAYGKWVPATAIILVCRQTLPFVGEITVTINK